MKILVLNCGSSSIKYKLFDMDRKEVIAQGGIEKIGLKDSFLKFTLPSGEKKVLERDIPEHTVGVEFILNTLTSPEYGAIKSLDEINAVGHRMVHGGEKFSESVRLTPEVLAAFTACNDLAPLHNPANLKGVNAISAILPNVPQIGVFDTAFHQTMPKHAYLYAVPYELYEKYGVRRYGFHGTSHRYVSQRVCEFLGVEPEGKKIITCHIGNGGSITAIKDGKCVDTSMGLTPLEGLMMGTRSGDIDAGAVSFIMEKEGLDANGISNLLNKKSGVLGIFGESSEKVIEHYEKADYCSRDIYENDKRIKECVDFIVSEKMLALGHKENLERLHHELVSKDWFMTLLDFNDYVEKKDQALADYADRKTWAKKMLVNIAKAGFFSSDRTIAQYNNDIWHLTPAK